VTQDQEQPGVLVQGDLFEPVSPRVPAVLRAVHERPTYRWWVLVAVLSGLFATGLTITVLTTAVPFIRADLDAPLGAVTWVVSAPFLFRSIFVPAFGKAGDVVGRRRMWLLGFALSAFASLLCGFAPNLAFLVLFRALAAIGSAAVIPSSMALIAAAFEPDERVKALGWWSMTIAVSPLLGVILGGFVVEDLGWRWLFYLQFPFSVVALLLGIVVLRESRGDRDPPFDVAGCVLSIGGLGALLLVLNRGPVGDWTWGSPRSVAAAVTAFVMLAAFVLIERRSPSPILPVQYFARRRFSAAVATNFFANFAYMGGFFVTSLMLAEPALFGYRADQVALAVSPRAASLGIMGPVGGYLAARYGGRRMAVLGMCSIFASMVALAWLQPHSPYLVILPGLVLSGIGLGLVAPPSAATVTNEAAPADLASASGALNMGASIGSSIGIAGMQAVLVATAVTAANPGMGAYAASFRFGAVASAIGIVTACGLGTRARAGADQLTPTRRRSQ